MSTPGSLLLSGARILDPARGLDYIGHLGTDGGTIVWAAQQPPERAFDEHREVQGLWLMPAAIDLAARFREPGESHKASFAGEAAAACAGGIGTVVLQPDTLPVVDSPAVMDRIRGIAAGAPGLHYEVLGALTLGLQGQALAGMSALRTAGCAGFAQTLAPIADALVGRRALEYAHGLGAIVHVQAQDRALANGGCAHEGAVATRLGLPAIPVSAEVAALRMWISLVEDTGARLHFGRLSTARGVSLVQAAQARGLPVSADVAAHQLFLTEDALEGFDARAHVLPPLRGVADRDALREGLRSGVIQALCSDHQPHEPDAKTNPFPLTEPGISALETLLPLGLALVHEGLLSPLELAARLSQGPAAVLGRPAPTLQAQQPADLVLIEPEAEWTLQAANMRSAGRNTPFDGRRFRGQVRATAHAGVWVYGAPGRALT